LIFVNSNKGSSHKGVLIPASRFSTETRISNSRFIATIAPAFSVDDAKSFIRDINHLYSDATHNVPVYQIGSGSSVIAHSSDNGEPPGTAGRPALAVLSGSGLADAVMVITRYFGGTKLGTGGLVKAYTESAQSVIKAVPKARKVSIHYCEINIPYNIYEQTARIIRISGAKIEQEIFTERVTVQFAIPVGSYEKLSGQIIEFTKGQISVVILTENQTAIVPLS
jgi:uncharacterized YigZ family protein